MDESSQIIEMVHLFPPAFRLSLISYFWMKRNGDQGVPQGHLLP